MTISRFHLDAILAAADTEMGRIPTVGLPLKPRGFTLDREQVEFLRETLHSGESDDILANDQTSVRETVQDWLESAKVWKLDRVIAACSAALT
jgi:hypothetical protein